MKQRKHYPRGQDESQIITRAVTHIWLEATNAGKLAVLDDLARVYMPLCQQYVTLFCTDEQPNKFRSTCFVTPLSERWHRVAIQQAAGIAQSWRTNRAQAYQDYMDDLLDYQEQRAEGVLGTEAEEPAWCCGRPVSRPTSTLSSLNPPRIPPLTTGLRSARSHSANSYLSR